MKIKISDSNVLETSYGIKLVETGGKIYLQQVAPDSEAYTEGIAKDDIITAINSIPVNTVSQLLEIMKATSNLTLTISRGNNIYEYSLKSTGRYYMKYELQRDEEAGEQPKRNFQKWSNAGIL